jgi:hypothetical protein
MCATKHWRLHNSEDPTEAYCLVKETFTMLSPWEYHGNMLNFAGNSPGERASRRIFCVRKDHLLGMWEKRELARFTGTTQLVTQLPVQSNS